MSWWRRWRLNRRPLATETAVRLIYVAVALNLIALGLAILVGGPNRFPFPTYQPLLDMTGGEVWPWSAWAVTSGTLMCVPRPHVRTVGLVAGFLWSNMFAAMFTVALVRYPNAGSTAPFPYLTISVITVVLIAHYVATCRRRE